MVPPSVVIKDGMVGGSRRAEGRARGFIRTHTCLNRNGTVHGNYRPKRIGRYLDFYNSRRPHSSLDGTTPDQAYFTPLPLRLAA